MYASHVALSRSAKISIIALAIASVAVAGIASYDAAIREITARWVADASIYHIGLLILLLSMAGRILLSGILRQLRDGGTGQTPVAIYGAGDAGLQLFAALKTSKDYRPVFFVDDSPAKQRLVIAGLRVKSYEALDRASAAGKIAQVFLAMPSISHEKRKRLSDNLLRLKVKVKVMPSYADILTAGSVIQSLNTISPDDLLGRDKVDLDMPEIAATYRGRSVLVTGAGGSIGSELARQIVRANARKLVLYEHSEHALYQIERELRSKADAQGVKLVLVLASVTDAERARAVLRAEDIDIVLHTAAYKHVPMMEDNEISGARNNVIGTQIMADAASATGVRRFLLVSTDKAVRPTNIMGATKRLAELVVQDRQSRSKHTTFSMVRFGNVLGSSGSVIPLFREQIKAGGPITLTHPDVTRYFMTIPEAARLVLVAGSYAEGGEIFMLKMGQPVRIYDVARRMVDLSGLSVRDARNPAGEIELKYIGLRPGEKLFEELFIDAHSMRTPHPKIMCAEEAMFSQFEIARMLHDLSAAIDINDAPGVRQIIRNWVDGYHTYAPSRELSAVN